MATVTGALYMDAGVELLEIYHYSVAVVTSSGESIASPELEVAIADPNVARPPVPSGFALTIEKPSRIGFEWTTGSDTILYEVYRSTQPDRGFVMVGEVTEAEFVDANNVLGYHRDPVFR
ncbi:MAG: hypothetical protein ACREIA_25390 [Opitutaceae bacterium]